MLLGIVPRSPRQQAEISQVVPQLAQLNVYVSIVMDVMTTWEPPWLRRDLRVDFWCRMTTVDVSGGTAGATTVGNGAGRRSALHAGLLCAPLPSKSTP